MISKSSNVVYIAGPMRGYVDHNYPAFDKAKELGLLLGFHVISPADMDRCDDKAKMAALSPLGKQELYARRDLWSVFKSTHVAMLPGWEKSIGARSEYFTAKWLSRQILDAETFEPLPEIELIIKYKDEYASI